MARAVGYFAQAVSAPAVRAALSKVARSHSVAEFVHLLTAHHGDAVECELHSQLAAFQQPTAHPIAAPSANGDADLDASPPPDLGCPAPSGQP
jgi:hypothetical protein